MREIGSEGVYKKFIAEADEPTLAEKREALDVLQRQVEQEEAAQAAAERTERVRAEEARMERFDRERQARIADAAQALQAKTATLHVKKDDYTADLKAVAKAAVPLLATLRGYRAEYEPTIEPLRRLNQEDLTQFYRPEGRAALVAAQMFRRLAAVTAIFNNTIPALESLPARTRQVDNMVGLSSVPEIRYVNGLKKELSQHRDSVEAVPGLCRGLVLLAEELAFLLRDAGAPTSTWRVISSEARNPNAEPTVEITGPIERSF